MQLQPSRPTAILKRTLMQQRKRQRLQNRGRVRPWIWYVAPTTLFCKLIMLHACISQDASHVAFRRAGGIVNTRHHLFRLLFVCFACSNRTESLRFQLVMAERSKHFSVLLPPPNTHTHIQTFFYDDHTHLTSLLSNVPGPTMLTIFIYSFLSLSWVLFWVFDPVWHHFILNSPGSFPFESFVCLKI